MSQLLRPFVSVSRRQRQSCSLVLGSLWSSGSLCGRSKQRRLPSSHACDSTRATLRSRNSPLARRALPLPRRANLTPVASFLRVDASLCGGRVASRVAGWRAICKFRISRLHQSCTLRTVRGEAGLSPQNSVPWSVLLPPLRRRRRRPCGNRRRLRRPRLLGHRHQHPAAVRAGSSTMLADHVGLFATLRRQHHRLPMRRPRVIARRRRGPPCTSYRQPSHLQDSWHHFQQRHRNAALSQSRATSPLPGLPLSSPPDRMPDEHDLWIRHHLPPRITTFPLALQPLATQAQDGVRSECAVAEALQVSLLLLHPIGSL